MKPGKKGLPQGIGKPSGLMQETCKPELGEIGKETGPGKEGLPEELGKPSGLEQETCKPELGEKSKGPTGTEQKGEDVGKGVQIPIKGVEASQ